MVTVLRMLYRTPLMARLRSQVTFPLVWLHDMYVEFPTAGLSNITSASVRPDPLDAAPSTCIRSPYLGVHKSSHLDVEQPVCSAEPTHAKRQPAMRMQMQHSLQA